MKTVEPEMLSLKQVCSLLSVGRDSATYFLNDCIDLKPVRIGNHLRWSKARIMDAINTMHNSECPNIRDILNKRKR